jgi:shikimate dehydrogenase
MHNAAYRDMGLDAVYLAASVPAHRLGEALRGLRTLGFLGANLTLPLKEAALPYLDELEEPASTLRAVNTVREVGGRLVGSNTDATGWLRSWEEQIGEPLEGRRVLLLGAGGAARAIFWALAMRGAGPILVMNRDHDRAAALVEDLGRRLRTASRAMVLDSDLFGSELGPGTVVINCTPVGMSPHTEESPVVWPRPLPPGVVACDLIYNPLNSLFLATARRRGARVMGGLGMLVHQAAAAIELWTGRRPSLEVMRRAALRALRGSYHESGARPASRP